MMLADNQLLTSVEDSECVWFMKLLDPSDLIQKYLIQKVISDIPEDWPSHNSDAENHACDTVLAHVHLVV